MIGIGYMLKKPPLEQVWLEGSGVSKVCVVSECIVENFCDFVEQWKHNGYWFFDTPEVIDSLAKKLSIDIQGMSLFYFEVLEEQFDQKKKEWIPFQPEEDFTTSVLEAKNKQLLGYDVVSYSHQNMPECSPLVCNQLAQNISVNQYCLLDDLADARLLLEQGHFENTEPGPFRVLAVYSVDPL